jgi:hypothetical protein
MNEIIGNYENGIQTYNYFITILGIVGVFSVILNIAMILTFFKMAKNVKQINLKLNSVIYELSEKIK